MRASVEEETGDTYSEFTPLLYLLVDGYYIVKVTDKEFLDTTPHSISSFFAFQVAVGGNSCVHIKFKMQGRTPQLDDFEEGKNKADKLQKF